MQIDPAALSRTDSSNQAKSAASNPSTTVKSSRTLPSVPRLDLEQTYTELKTAIGDKWAEYKESTAFFLLGMKLISSIALFHLYMAVCLSHYLLLNGLPATN